VVFLPQGIPEQTIDEIRQRCDLVGLVGEYLTLEKRGKNMLGLCPFHSEKTPSFTVSPEKQLFHCFGCGASGNVFSFIMKLENLTFPEAARFLAGRAGVKIPERKATRTAEDGLREQILAINRLAARYYAYILLQSTAGKKAAEYLRERGITRDSSELFMLGYAPPGWENFSRYAQKKGFSPELLQQAGLVSARDGGGCYDRFRDRIIFPITNPGGEAIGFGGRALSEGEKAGPKYLNSPETPVFEKGASLFGLHLARERIRREKAAVVMEGYTDVITAHQAGLANAVASLGTSLTSTQARLLRSQAEKVFIAYDADRAGEAATWRGLKLLRDIGCLVQVVDLPAGSDPDDLIRKEGAAAFREMLQNAKPLVDYQLDFLKKRCGPATEEGRLHYMQEALSLLAALSSPVERDLYLKRMAEELGVSEAALREEVGKGRQKGTAVHNLSLKDQTNNINQIRVYPADKMLVSLMILDPAAVALVCASLEHEDFESEPARQVAGAIFRLAGANRPVSAEALVSLFEDPAIHSFIAGAATDPSLQDLPCETIERMARDCINKIVQAKLTRQQRQGQQKLREKDREKSGLDEQARILLREYQQVIDQMKGGSYRSGGGEDFNG
jgi:DNA primase